MKNGDAYILLDIISYCKIIYDFIKEYGNSGCILNKDFAYQYSISFCLQRIGGSVNRFSDEFVKRNEGKISLQGFRLLGYQIAYDFSSVDFNTIWEIITNDIPELESFCKNKLKENHTSLG
jgi:uncharacterized protein with HEPN domain